MDCMIWFLSARLVTVADSEAAGFSDQSGFLRGWRCRCGSTLTNGDEGAIWMTNSNLLFEPIKEGREGYFVDYRPPQPGLNFAILTVVFISDIHWEYDEDRVKGEAVSWLRRYPVSLMVIVRNSDDNMVSPPNALGCYLGAWADAENDSYHFSWLAKDFEDALASSACLPYLPSIYAGLGYQKVDEVRAEAYQKAVDRGRLYKQLRHWLAWPLAIPFGFAVFVFLGPSFFGILVLLYAFWKSLTDISKALGWSRLTGPEWLEQERRKRMDYYFYHCEKNPNSFERLVTENHANDIRANLQHEAESLGLKTDNQ
jgi:hypothetical protein